MRPDQILGHAKRIAQRVAVQIVGWLAALGFIVP
jgi:hypothetical protein